jgi:hypothetical protein
MRKVILVVLQRIKELKPAGHLKGLVVIRQNLGERCRREKKARWLQLRSKLGWVPEDLVKVTFRNLKHINMKGKHKCTCGTKVGKAGVVKKIGNAVKKVKK